MGGGIVCVCARACLCVRRQLVNLHKGGILSVCVCVFVCVCVCVCVCTCVCVCVCVCGGGATGQPPRGPHPQCVCVCARARERACVRARAPARVRVEGEQLVNLHEDPQKDGAVIYPLRGGETNVGRPDCAVNMQIKLVRQPREGEGQRGSEREREGARGSE